MLELRNRKGAMMVLGALLFVGLMIMAVLAVDFSRIVEQRNAIHTAADAGAHAGAVQLYFDKTTAVDSAIEYASRNMPPGAPAPTAEVGRWNDSAQTFTTGGNLDEANAVRVRTQRMSNYLIGNGFGILPATMRRSAIAWSEAPVGATDCVKPWGIPYTRLTTALQPTNPDSLRDLTGDDLVLLNTLPAGSRRFMVKAGPPAPDNGNFYALDIPNPDAPGQGAARYEENIATCNTTVVGVGDTLQTQTGNIPNGTIDGASVLCQPLLNQECFNAGGTVGLPVKVVLWLPPPGGCQGTCNVVVKLIGSFVVDTVCQEKAPPGCEDKGIVKGYFDRMVTQGTVGTSKSTVQRPILVQ